MTPPPFSEIELLFPFCWFKIKTWILNTQNTKNNTESQVKELKVGSGHQVDAENSSDVANLTKFDETMRVRDLADKGQGA